jgi:hypothetical protein
MKRKSGTARDGGCGLRHGGAKSAAAELAEGDQSEATRALSAIADILAALARAILPEAEARKMGLAPFPSRPAKCSAVPDEGLAEADRSEATRTLSQSKIIAGIVAMLARAILPEAEARKMGLAPFPGRPSRTGRAGSKRDPR